jgi:hypothetical protein
MAVNSGHKSEWRRECERLALDIVARYGDVAVSDAEQRLCVVCRRLGDCGLLPLCMDGSDCPYFWPPADSAGRDSTSDADTLDFSFKERETVVSERSHAERGPCTTGQDTAPSTAVLVRPVGERR